MPTYHDIVCTIQLVISYTDLIDSGINFITACCEIYTPFSGRIPKKPIIKFGSFVSNKFFPTRRKTCYESEAEPGGSPPLVLTIRSNYSKEELAKPAGKQVLEPCLIKVAAFSLSLSFSLSPSFCVSLSQIILQV